MDFNSNFEYDLKVGQVAEQQLAEILADKKIEVKRDLKATKTGNIFIEYEYKGNPSGIAKSHADWYCFFLSEETFVMIQTEKLKLLCRNYLKSGRDVSGGDSNKSRGILLPLEIIFKNS